MEEALAALEVAACDRLEDRAEDTADIQVLLVVVDNFVEDTVDVHNAVLVVDVEYKPVVVHLEWEVRKSV